MNNQSYFDVSNKSLNLTYQIMDILIAVIFFALVFGAIYKAFVFALRTIGLIISVLFGGLIPERKNHDSYEDDLSEEARTARRACYTEYKQDNKSELVKQKLSKQSDEPKFQIEAGKHKTFDEMINNKSKYN